MKKTYKKKEEKLTSEGTELRQPVAELEAPAAERKQDEQLLRKTEEDKLAILNSISELVAYQDTEHRILWTNKAAAESVGLTAAQLVGRYCYEIWLQRSQPCAGCPVAKARQTGKPQEAEITTPDGRLWLVHAYPKQDATGNITGVVEVTTDITERKQAEEALKESEKFNLSLLANSPNPVNVINPDTSIRYVNPALEKLTGFTLAEIIGCKAPYPYWTEERVKKITSDLETAMRRKAVRIEELYRNKSGEQFWAEITSAPISKNGEFKYLLANWVDITERKQAEEKERELQRELYLSSRLASIGELAAGVAHQLNNPLTGVLGFSQRLLRKSTDEEASQDLKRIYTETERAAKIVQNLLTFARRREAKKEYSNVNNIVQGALELRAYELKTSNIDVITNLDPSLPKIMLDFHQIQEVFLNIILNAEQAMTEANGGGKLIIKTEKKNGYTRTTFTDDGPGILSENLDNVLDPFFTTKGEKGGTGLGLSVCHGIISEHGGKIYARSKPGKGATFFVELPIIAEE